MYSSKNKYCIFLLLLQILISCDDNRSVVSPVYYDIDSLISHNAEYFGAVHPVLEKQARINDKTDTSLVTPPDSTAWAMEMDILRQIAAINNPVNRGRYTFEDNIDDRKSNLTICQYTATDDLPVRFLRIFYMRNRSEIRRIEAQCNEKNALYRSSRFFTIKLHKVFNKILIESYTVSGSQKMILGDSVNFDLNGKLTFQSQGTGSLKDMEDPVNY